MSANKKGKMRISTMESYISAARQAIGRSSTHLFSLITFAGRDTRQHPKLDKLIKEDLLFFQIEYQRLIAQSLNENKNLKACWQNTQQISNSIVRHALQKELINLLAMEQLAEQTAKNAVNSAVKEQAIKEINEKIASVKTNPVLTNLKTTTDYAKFARNWDKFTSKELTSISLHVSGSAIGWFCAISTTISLRLVNYTKNFSGIIAEIVAIGTHPIGWAWLGFSLLCSAIAGYFKYRSQKRLKLRKREQDTHLQLRFNQLEYERLSELTSDNAELLLSLKTTWASIAAVTHKGLRVKLQHDLIEAINKPGPAIFKQVNQDINDFLQSESYRSFLNLLRYQKILKAIASDPGHNKNLKAIKKQWRACAKIADPVEKLTAEKEFFAKIKAEAVSAPEINAGHEKTMSNNALSSAIGRFFAWFTTGVGAPGIIISSFANIKNLFEKPGGGVTLALGLILAIPAGLLKFISQRKKNSEAQKAQIQEKLHDCKAEWRKYIDIFAQTADKEGLKELSDCWKNLNAIDDPNERCARQEGFINDLNELFEESYVNQNNIASNDNVNTDDTIAKNMSQALPAKLKAYKNLLVNHIDTKINGSADSNTCLAPTDYMDFVNNWDKLTAKELSSTRRSAFGAFSKWTIFAFSTSSFFTLLKLTGASLIAVLSFGILTKGAGLVLLGLACGAILIGALAYNLTQKYRAKLKLKEREKKVQQQLGNNQLEYERLELFMRDKPIATNALWQQIAQVPPRGLRAKLQADFNEKLLLLKNTEATAAAYTAQTDTIRNFLANDQAYKNYLLQQREANNLAIYKKLTTEKNSFFSSISRKFAKFFHKSTPIVSPIIAAAKKSWEFVNDQADLAIRVKLQEAFIDALQQNLNTETATVDDFEKRLSAILFPFSSDYMEMLRQLKITGNFNDTFIDDTATDLTPTGIPTIKKATENRKSPLGDRNHFSASKSVRPVL